MSVMTYWRGRIRAVFMLWIGLLPILAHGAEQQLNLFIWSEYIDPAVVADFEKQHHCQVVIDLYEDESAMMAKLQGGGAEVYDIVVPPDHKVPALINLKLIAPLRHDKIPNLKNIDRKFMDAPYDRGNRFTVPYQWGTLGIYVRKTAAVPLVPSWGILFEASLQPGPFVLMDNARDLLGAALKFKGHSINSTDPGQLKAARDLVLSAKKRCLGFDGSVGAKNKVLTKTARAAMVYSGEAVRGMGDDAETVYLIPREGSQIWQDNLAILARAPHRELAELFINYALEPKVAARISTFTQFASPNKAAREFIPPETLKNPAIYPPEEVMGKLEFLQDLGARARLYEELWTQIKSK
jgi:spermidine/putrescine transport system substrate-binding protein